MKAVKVWFADTDICIETDTGKTGKLPLKEFPRLHYATEEQRKNYKLSAFGIHWPEIDEDLSYEGFFDYSLPEESELRKKLGEVLDIVSLSYIAQRYFGKTRAWLYQRINGNMVNGRPAQFTTDELKRLDEALRDIGRKLGQVSVI